MSQKRRFIQCDVFTSTPGKGNALAVVVDGSDLTDQQMQDFAAWTNLAETTFLMPPTNPEADYKVRIFTTVREMPFAGHPTLGSCAAWLHTGGQPADPNRIRQECNIGIVDVIKTDQHPAFIAPPTTVTVMDEEHENAILNKLAIDKSCVKASAILNNGPVWNAFELDSAESVLAVNSAEVKWADFGAIGLIGPHNRTHDCDYEVRMLAPSSGMSEDPITGSLNAAIAHWFNDRAQLEADLTIAQGTTINRLGRVYISKNKEDQSIEIGGQSHIIIEGEVFLGSDHDN